MREPRANELYFVPLGGSGEIGMNLNLYGHDGRWLMVDCGITFEKVGTRTEVLTPDPQFAVKRRDRLEALVITHAHEDHLGAVLHLWPQLRCPVFATPFCAAVLRRKLSEARPDTQRELEALEIHEVDRTQPLVLGPYTLRFVDVTHSTVESQAILVGTPLGTVLHTGDFKLDDGPLVGPTTDFDALARAADEGILAAVSDSTNATKRVASGSEAVLSDALRTRLLRAPADRRIALACFSSNIARIQTFVTLARQLERHPLILGRSLTRMIHSARSVGYLDAFEDEVPVRDFGYLPPSKVMLICTGTQAEPGSAMERIAGQSHRDVTLDSGDLVIFSSKIIPGNEAPIAAMHSQLRRGGIEVVGEQDGLVHVSGHPGQPELRRLYEVARPASVVPTHGELRHMEAHAELARSMGLPTLVPRNGDVIQLAPGPPKRLSTVATGRIRVEQQQRHRSPRDRKTRDREKNDHRKNRGRRAR